MKPEVAALLAPIVDALVYHDHILDYQQAAQEGGAYAHEPIITKLIQRQIIRVMRGAGVPRDAQGSSDRRKHSQGPVMCPVHHEVHHIAN